MCLYSGSSGSHFLTTTIPQMTVYLEQIGIANEVQQFFGIDKFRLVGS